MDSQKILTIKEPWATLIIKGYKKYEFRSWKTNYRGKVLIHAGKSTDKNVLSTFDSYNLDYNNGKILGEVEIVDCILVDNIFDKQLKQMDKHIYNNNHVGLYAWKLENVKEYDKKTQIKGKLGLWNYKK